MSITAASIILKFKQEEEGNIRQALQDFQQVSIEEQAPSGDLILYVEEDDYQSLHKTCSELGIVIPEEYVEAATFHDPKASGLATRRLLALKDRPTCILYPDDFSFIGGMNELEKQGVSIPKDMSVAGYDGILLSQVLRPRLTTYRQDAEAMGREAARQLLEIIERPKEWIPQQIMIPGRLLEGDTIRDIRQGF